MVFNQAFNVNASPSAFELTREAWKKILGGKLVALSFKIISKTVCLNSWLILQKFFLTAWSTTATHFYFFIIITNRWIKIIDKARDDNRSEVSCVSRGINYNLQYRHEWYQTIEKVGYNRLTRDIGFTRCFLKVTLHSSYLELILMVDAPNKVAKSR